MLPPDLLQSALPLLFMLAAFFLPGIVTLLPLRPGWPAAVALGPAVTLLVLTTGSLLLDAIGVPWSLGPVAVFLLVPPIVVHVLARRVSFRAPLVPTPEPLRAAGLAAGLLVGGTLISAALMRGMGSLGRASHGWDPIFHVNALTWIQESGRATPWSFNPIFGDGPGTYYPAGWHDVVGLYPGDLVEAANASSIVIGGIIWPIGLMFLARIVLPRRPAVWATVPVLAASFVSFPASQLLRSGQWPNGLATALVPAALALVLLLLGGGGTRPGGLRDRILTLALALAVLAGCVAAHPSAAFGLGAAALPFLLARAVPALVSGLRRRRRTTLLAAAAVTAFGAVVVVGLMTSRLLVGVMNYPRATRAVLPDALALALFDLPRFPAVEPPTVGDVNLIVGILVLAGVVLTLVLREARPLAASWLVFVVLYVLAAGPENPLRFLTGVWYKDTQRLAPFIAMAGSILAAFALAVVVGGIVRLLSDAVQPRLRITPGGTRAVTAVLVVVLLAAVYVGSAGFRAEARASVAAHNYATNAMPGIGVLSRGEQDFIRRAGSLIPQDAVVIGDPFNGETFFYALTKRRVVYTQLGAPAPTAAQQLLRSNFNRLTADPAVCEAIADVGATHFYQDAPGSSHGSSGLESWPGFYGVDTQRGLAPVITEGGRGLYEITGCP
ncbi:hypothetical protein E8P82_07430 [Arthrobacter echini]|uniref:Uncharacterized protein n=1 Tax=Arthrobacter echini TaxID=1529066 RepID=A0A4S5E5H4_9MICC|nr:DUF6541 family protein [Arthrobacter echini]THJ66761.1 hypothetical protein E8P82_07430 [Arthrobacter echini]